VRIVPSLKVEGIMPSWLIEAQKLAGFATPVVYAFATYRVFMHFDKRGLSAKAKKAISDWLQPMEYDRALVGDAIVEVFNRIYTSELMSWSAFARSAVITLIVSSIFYFEMFGVSDFVLVASGMAGLWAIVLNFAPPLLANIFSDYAALFVVKWSLMSGRRSSLTAFVLGPLAALLFVIIAFLSRQLLTVVFFSFSEPGDAFENFRKFFSCPDVFINDVYINTTGAERPFSIAALVVHLWLPLFGLSVAVLRMLNYFRVAVGRTQWLLSRGDAHPMEAIGYVASAIVFLATMVLQRVF
jgi:hypothetical protein